MPGLEAPDETDDELLPRAPVPHCPGNRPEDARVGGIADDAHAPGPGALTDHVVAQRGGGNEHAVGELEELCFECLGDHSVVQGSVLRLLEAERGVDLEEEGDAVVPGEAQGGVSPERVALVDDVDVPAGVEPLEPLVDVLVQEEGEGLTGAVTQGVHGHPRAPTLCRPREGVNPSEAPARPPTRRPTKRSASSQA